MSLPHHHGALLPATRATITATSTVLIALSDWAIVEIFVGGVYRTTGPQNKVCYHPFASQNDIVGRRSLTVRHELAHALQNERHGVAHCCVMEYIKNRFQNAG
jgi:hypothetical protein